MTRTFFHSFDPPAASPISGATVDLEVSEIEDAGIRATLAQTLDGPRVMVWPGDETRARAKLSGR